MRLGTAFDHCLVNMTGRNPYFVKKGQADEDGFITTVASCLKIMNYPKDVCDNHFLETRAKLTC